MSDPVPDDKAGSFPHVVDSCNYQLTVNDFVFLGINEASAWSCSAKEVPLGIPAAEFPDFVSSLFYELDLQGFHDADVRLQGSSTTFWSNPTKTLPTTRTSRAKLFVEQNHRMPDKAELDEIDRRYESTWGHDHPVQRPFDSLLKLGISEEASDIDVQISSAAAFALANKAALRLELSLAEMRVNNPSYDFLITEISELEFLYVARWSSRWSDRLGRQVSVKFFDRGGPPKNEQGISSHFSPTDWIVTPSKGAGR